MEEKNGDNEERRDSERLTIRQNKSYYRRPLSNRTSDNYQINRNNRRSVTISVIDDEPRYRPVSRRSEHIPSSMKSSTSTQHIANSSFADQQQQQQNHYHQPLNDQETSTYSFRHVTKKLQHAKSHGELYQPHAPLPLPPMTKLNNDENEIKHRLKYPSESPQISSSSTKPRSATTTAVVPITIHPTINPSDETFNLSSSNKLPLWKRFKQMIVPTKRTKEPQTSSVKVPALQLNELSTNDRNRTVTDSFLNQSHHHHHLKNPIKLNELRTWLISKPFPEQRIRDEYEKLPVESLHPKTLAFRPENKVKNRFNAIEPYDHSRVVLRPLISDPFSDYINASYIDGYRASKLYIAAQAPTETTLYDFIRMIWQLRIQSIIMVTRLFEDGKHKCIQYWPDEGEKRVNDFRIRIDSEDKYADYTIRKFVIFNPLESTDALTVKQYHFLSWPDHGCLSLSTPLLDFRQRFRTDYKSLDPILVHCSAGVGRSGTFIALDALLEQAEHQETIDILDFTHRMRQNRVYMIQTVEQYVFLYRTLIEGLLTMDTSISLQEYMITKKLHMDPKNQYKLLEQLQSTIEYSYRGALELANISKNRVETILAPDHSRPYLMTQVDKTTDYINAIFINSYRQTPSYIVTQYPLPHTCIDFWRLVYDHNVSIIMLLEPISRDAKTIHYWSTNIGQATLFGPFEIVLVSQKEDEQLIERVFEMKCVNKSVFTADRTRTIRQFQVKDHSHLLLVVKRFLKEMRTYSEQNVILQCLNGATWSGYFAALCNSIDKMQTEQIIDPFKVVRLLRAIRPQFIDQEQYENLFLSIRDYIQQYLTTTSASSSPRTTDNSFYMHAASDQDQASAANRIIQRL